MDRNALLLYLQNVRDLEIVRTKIWREWKAQLASIDEKIKRTQTEAHYEMIPSLKSENSDSGRSFIIIFAGMAGMVLFIYLNDVSEHNLRDIGSHFVCFFFIALFSFLAWWMYSLEKDDRKRRVAEAENARMRNIQQDQIAQRGKTQVEQYQQTKKKTDDIYRKKYNEAARILSRFYAMNILPNQYRNLASTVYIYDYMSSSQASLEDTLIHEHMEDGIQRLAARLDRMADRLEEVVYETRCIRDENRASVERTIGQNERMLRQLENVSHNTQEAARYAELASNYSRANAYFALADHLQ